MTELIEAINRHWHFIMADGRREGKRKEKISAFIMSLLKEEVWRRFSSVIKSNEECTRIAEDAQHGKIDPYSAVEKILEKARIESSKGNDH